MDVAVRQRIIRNAGLSLLIYALPVVLLFWTLYLTRSGPTPYPWQWTSAATSGVASRFLNHALNAFNGYGLVVFMILLGAVEFSFGLYEDRWTNNEKALDISCFLLPKFVTGPLIAYCGLKFLPMLLPGLRNTFAWVPFFWGFLIICVADDLTQYWYHRLHHEIPWLWRFHRTHHSAPYMGMAMTSRQNIWYTIFFSQTYVTTVLTYLGLGASAVVVLAVKSIITTLAHSSIPWDKPLYQHKALHPVAWILERLISTPATHHAHHAAVNDDGVGYYKGNFGNMFFLWDVIFGTALISRKYPQVYGISHYEGDQWYAQLLWPVFKSKIEGSELAAGGPAVRTDEAVACRTTDSAIGQAAVACRGSVPA